MFGIGQFAQLAKVSIRALRHYDEVGLLRPVHVDPSNGYRFYAASQLPELNRVLVLKDLGFTLAEITRLTEVGVSQDELLGMLRLRQAEAERAADVERLRLNRVAARIHLLNGAPSMSATEAAVVVKPLDATRVVTATEATEGFDDHFAPIFERLYDRVFSALNAQGVAPSGPHCAFYEERPDGRIDVIAAVPIADDADVDADEVAIQTLPSADRAATLVHVGDMDDCASSYQILQEWIDAAGEQPAGFSREVYLDCSGPRDTWVTELQFVLRN